MEVAICCLFVVYLVPFVVAARNDHERLGAILALNALLGWTLVGWWLALRWARRPATPEPEPVVVRRKGHLRLIAPGSGAGRDALGTPAPHPTRPRAARPATRSERDGSRT